MEEIDDQRGMGYISDIEEITMEDIDVQRGMGYLNDTEENVREKVKMARAQATSDISVDMRKMINNPEYSDIVFCCKDGVQVHASRLFLVARSTVFHRMLLNGMVESQLSKVTLHEISSNALLPVMEFLYTGILQDYAPKDWRNAYEIIGAARFFLLEGPELFAVDYLILAVAKAAEDIEAAAKCLCIAVEFAGIFSGTVDLIARNLVCILESASLKPEHLQGLTSEAFLYFLENTKIEEEEESRFLSNAEFVRLKNIITWCACRAFAPKESLTPHVVLPEIISTFELLDESLFRDEPCQPSDIYNGIKPALALSVKEYLSFVNLRRISPRLLVNIIEPLDIVPSSAITEAFRFHALQAPHYIVKDDINWYTGSTMHKMYKMSRDRCVIQQMKPGIGFAMYGLLIIHTGWDRYFEWEITIEKVCDDFIEIGLYQVFEEELSPRRGQSLSGQPGGWALRMDPQGLSISRSHRGDSNFVPFGKDCTKLAYGKDYAHENSKIRVNFSMLPGECSFNVVNDRFGDLACGIRGNQAWFSIPHGRFYPAVSLGTGSGGRVRSKILAHDG